MLCVQFKKYKSVVCSVMSDHLPHPPPNLVSDGWTTDYFSGSGLREQSWQKFLCQSHVRLHQTNKSNWYQIPNRYIQFIKLTIKHAVVIGILILKLVERIILKMGLILLMGHFGTSFTLFNHNSNDAENFSKIPVAVSGDTILQQKIDPLYSTGLL